MSFGKLRTLALFFSFKLSIEDWIFECVKLFDGYFLRLGTLLDEINQSLGGADELSEYALTIVDRIKFLNRKKKG